MNWLYDHLPVSAQNAACTVAGAQRRWTRFGRHFRRRLAELESTASGSQEALQEIQRSRLTDLVRRARAHVPAYRDLPPPSEKADPSECIAETLSGIPPLEKKSYGEDPWSFVARDIPRYRLKRGKTSGTTGTALPLWHTARTLSEEYATVWRMRRSFGARLDDPHLSFGGRIIVPFEERHPPFWRVNAYGGQTIFSLYHMSPRNLDAYVDEVHRAPARYAEGYPSSLFLVAEAMLAAGRPLPEGRLCAVFTSSESLLAFHRTTIEKAFSAPVRDRYGTTEFTVSMTGCSENRLHVDEEFCIVEVEPTEETADYVRGSLLVTGLANDASTFLRYRIGDVAARMKGVCPCGRPGDVFLEVDGRMEDYVVTPDNRRIGRLDHIFKSQFDIGEAQILQEASSQVQLLVVPRASWSNDSERRLLQEIRARLGSEIAVEIRLVDSIPREPNGKFRIVRSRIGRLRP